MVETKGRSPAPKRGDPNVKSMRVSLSPEEWRKLRAWAAEEGTSVQAIVVRLLRRTLDKRPSTRF
jgi:hypothetical protein